MPRLYSAVVVNAVRDVLQSDVEVAQATMTHVFPIPHPRPGSTIAIIRILGRMHYHTGTIHGGAHEFALALFRLSDFAIMGGAVFEFRPGNSVAAVGADRETNWAPSDYFLLAPGDGLVATLDSFGRLGAPVRIGAFIAVAYNVIGNQAGELKE
jgi:hypothetical protein